MSSLIETMPTPKEPTLSRAGRIFTNPSLKYVGLALLLSWHYVRWFVPHMFLWLDLLDDRVTFAWLANLGATAFSILLIAALLGRGKHLSSHSWLYAAAPILSCTGTLALCLPLQTFTVPGLAYLIVALLSLTESVMWVLWSEQFACAKARFSLFHVVTTFGLTLLSTTLLAWVLPPCLTTVFASCLPLVSGCILAFSHLEGKESFPVLLPKSTIRDGIRNMEAVSFIVFLASAACYFLVAIIPWEKLATGELSFTLGTVGGAGIMLALSLVCVVTKNRVSIFRMLPWILVLLIIAFGLFLADEKVHLPSFIMAVGISTLLEIMLVMYFGILTSKGYVSPATAFAFAVAPVRAGILAGNSLAILYERNPTLAFAITPETSLAFMCLLAVLLVPCVRREFGIIALTTVPPPSDEVDNICLEVANEFGLSCRESEVLVLIARGYATGRIADKLVISPHTVNTHVRHIYEKMQIHRRSELLNYLNKHRSDF